MEREEITFSELVVRRAAAIVDPPGEDPAVDRGSRGVYEVSATPTSRQGRAGRLRGARAAGVPTRTLLERDGPGGGAVVWRTAWRTSDKTVSMAHPPERRAGRGRSAIRRRTWRRGSPTGVQSSRRSGGSARPAAAAPRRSRAGARRPVISLADAVVCCAAADTCSLAAVSARRGLRPRGGRPAASRCPRRRRGRCSATSPIRSSILSIAASMRSNASRVSSTVPVPSSCARRRRRRSGRPRGSRPGSR